MLTKTAMEHPLYTIWGMIVETISTDVKASS